jgi:hypothetical protein
LPQEIVPSTMLHRPGLHRAHGLPGSRNARPQHVGDSFSLRQPNNDDRVAQRLPLAVVRRQQCARHPPPRSINRRCAAAAVNRPFLTQFRADRAGNHPGAG